MSAGFAFEESRAQIVRNMRSVGVELQRWVDEGRLQMIAAPAAAHGLETHLARIYWAIEQFEPSNIVIDPLSSLQGEEYEINATLSRLIDHFKRRRITAVMTTLIRGEFEDRAGLGISSVIDTWVDVSYLEIDGERNRGINILKSRGMGHSHQVREFQITSQGFSIRDVYAGERGVLMVSAAGARGARALRGDRAGRRVRRQAPATGVPPRGAGGASRGAAGQAGGRDARARKRSRNRRAT
ncbi:MAG: ATPase domain-containing protein [Solirubrobacteraceae bacterium]